MSETSSAENSDIRRSPELLANSRSQLLVVDVQEKLLPVIQNADSVRQNCIYLIEAARALNVPVFASEQYPRGLGTTVREIADLLTPELTFEKMRFSAADGFQEVCASDNGTASVNRRNQIVIVGIEAHICVQQTAFDLLARGFDVYVAEDAVGSRFEKDCSAAMRRIRDSGAVVVTSESVAFEWCEVAGSETFKAVSRLTRDRTG